MARHISRLAVIHLSAAAVVAFVTSGPVSAQSALSLDVTAVVGNACSVDIKSGNTLDFGTLSGQQQDSTVTELTVSCDIADTQAILEIDDGQYSGAGDGNGPKLRSIDNPSVFIPYSLCQGDPGPDCIAPNGEPIIIGPGGTDRKVRARIDGGQIFTQVGSYEDQLSITVSFTD